MKPPALMFTTKSRHNAVAVLQQGAVIREISPYQCCCIFALPP